MKLNPKELIIIKWCINYFQGSAFDLRQNVFGTSSFIAICIQTYDVDYETLITRKYFHILLQKLKILGIIHKRVNFDNIGSK